MSCNGCRVLRKGGSETCVLRPCLKWIENPQSQGFATVFFAKFFGRADLMSFISAVPESLRPACGRTVNPVNGAIGLFSTGNWHICQAAVQTVLREGTLWPVPEFMASASECNKTPEAVGTAEDMWKLQETVTSLNSNRRFSSPRSKVSSKRETMDGLKKLQPSDLDLRLTPGFKGNGVADNRRPGTPSMNSEESITTATCFENEFADHGKLLNLFV